MGSKEFREDLDTEIKELEQAIWPDAVPPVDPAVSDAADQSPPGTGEPDVEQPSAATDTGPTEEEQVNFEVQQEQQAPSQAEDEKKPTRVSWKTRFTKLKQYHDTETYKTRVQIGQLYDKIATLESELKASRSELQVMKESKPLSIKEIATQEEIDAVGEEELATMHRLASKTADAATKDLKDRLAQAEAREAKLRQEQAQAARAQAYDIFLNRLETLVPDYAVIDVDPRFNTWLQEAEPTTGFVRKDLFQRAEASGDVGRVAGFFNEFKMLMNPAKQNLEQKVTPVGNSATPQPAKQEGQEIVPVAHYEKFMADVTRGRFKGRETEARQWEAYFDKAMAEGRLR